MHAVESFDRLFRRNLSELYRLLEHHEPTEVVRVNRANGEMVTPDMIVSAVEA